jgi:hypothetical protein
MPSPRATDLIRNRLATQTAKRMEAERDRVEESQNGAQPAYYAGFKDGYDLVKPLGASSYARAE